MPGVVAGVGKQCIVLEVNSQVCLLITRILKVEMVVVASLQTPGCPFGEDGWAFFGGRFPSFCGRSVFPRSPLLLCWISIVDSHSFYSGVVNLEKPHCSKNRPSFFQPPPRDLDGIFCVLFSFCKEMKKEEIESTVFACIALDLEYTLHNVVKRVV